MHVLDTRQWRTDQPCMDLLQPLCAAAESPTTTMLGTAQETWLFDRLQLSSARWNVLAQQVMMTQWTLGAAVGFDPPRFNMDAWDGYLVARQNLGDFLALARTANPIVLSGGIHRHWAAELRADFDDPEAPNVGVECVTTAISSDFPALYVDAVQTLLADNPHIRFFEGVHRGYVRCTVDRHVWRTEYRGVRSLLDPVAALDTIASSVVESGQLALMVG